VLDDTITVEQQVRFGSTKLSAAGFVNAHRPKQPAPYVPGLVEPFNGSSTKSAISRANMKAFEANRLQAETPPGLSFRNRPTTSLQPKTTSRQRKGTVRYRRSSRGSNDTEPQHPDYRPAREVLERSDLPQTTIFPAPTMPRQAAKKLTQNLQVHEPVISNEVSGDRCNLNRQSASVLALTEATKLNPDGVMAMRRSKTTRESGKTRAVKQKGVLKKMTYALTDRLHLTHKATVVEAHEADEDRGCGFYDYETNQFIRDVVADVPTQKRQLPSRLAEIFEREEPNRDSQHISDSSFERISDRKRSKSSISKESCGDPFADPDSPKRSSTDFVNRLKATTPSKDGRVPNPATPSASPTNMESLLRSSVNSLLPFAPVGASTPRIIIGRRRSYVGDESAKQSKLTNRMSASVLALTTDMDAVETVSDESSDDDSDDDMPSTGHNLAPVHGYTYQPVLNAPNRKKHPSPNKIDLELLETRLREKWPETLSQATEKAKKHPSPLKVDMQALGEQFRKAYPDLLGGNTPNHSEKGEDSYCVVKHQDDTDELALSFATSTPEKKRVVSRHRKVSSLACFSEAAALDAKTKRKTMAMSQYADLLSPASHMQLACPAYHHA
jgi:hypothetical protein